MIQIKDCSKRFDSVQAVDHVSLELNEKEVFGMEIGRAHV